MDYEKYYPLNIPCSKHEAIVAEKNMQINNLIKQNQNLISQLEDSLEVIKELKEEIKRYERLIRKN